mgnify:CR=1 FL=1|jgi:hypothetical protein|tara:strand:- start:106 stop:315 length:210 start_codon:yes stop_codon:yes gene_type:complete
MNYFKTPPRPIPKTEGAFHNLSRILPHYIAENFEYFELLPVPRKLHSNYEAYIANFKKKIACTKAELLL